MNEMECGKAGEVTKIKDVGIGRFAQFKRRRGKPTDRPFDRRMDGRNLPHRCANTHIKKYTKKVIE